MNDPTVQALGLALIHSLWECSLVALLFALFTFLFRGSNARYLAGCLAMLLMLAIPAITFFGILDSATTTAVAVATSGTSLAQPGPSSMADSQTVVPSSEPSSFFGLIVWLWLTGVIAMTAWSAAGWITAQRLKRRSTRPIAESWRQRVTVLAGRLRIRRTVRVYESILAQVPAVIGWIRPVILVPAGALIHLSAEELEAVLAHELAHIRRHDYLINLLQTAIETLLFYHPAVWWIGTPHPRRARALLRRPCCPNLWRPHRLRPRTHFSRGTPLRRSPIRDGGNRWRSRRARPAATRRESADAPQVAVCASRWSHDSGCVRGIAKYARPGDRSKSRRSSDSGARCVAGAGCATRATRVTCPCCRGSRRAGHARSA